MKKIGMGQKGRQRKDETEIERGIEGEERRKKKEGDGKGRRRQKKGCEEKQGSSEASRNEVGRWEG